MGLLERVFSPDRGEAVQAMQDERRSGVEDLITRLEESDVPPVEIYQLMLKRKRLGSILQQALRESGYDDLSKVARFRPQKLTEEEYR
jgi:hypothetical protein